MGIPPISFTGLSQFSENFALILERSFEIANLPIQQLQTEQTLNLARQQELSDLGATLKTLEDRFVSLSLLGAKSALGSSSSDTAVASVVVTGSPSTASFDINVTSAASAAQEVTTTSLASTSSGGVTADGVYALTVGATTTNFDLLTLGSGRTAGTTGATTPSPPVSVQVDFSNGLAGSITASLDSFFVAAAAPSAIGAGDTISVSFVSEDSVINEQITTVALTGTETTADIATLLNDQITANGNLNGKLSFSDEGGNLKLTLSDTVGQGFTFTSASTGSVVSGLESGGTVGGESAEEIAAALNAEVALDATLAAAGVTFTAVSGEVQVSGDQAFDITVSDNAQGTGFLSGLAGAHSVEAFDNTLDGLRDFINAQSSSLGVKASIINTSSDPDNPTYHLSVTATSTGLEILALKDSLAADLLTTSNQGTDAVFTVNGLAVTNSGNTIVNFEPGLTVTIEGAGSTTVSVFSDRATVSNSLANFAAEYNNTVAKIQTQIGEGAGILSGDIIVRQSQQALREITSFSGSGAIQSIVELGLEFDENGLLSFESLTFNSLTDDQVLDALEFIGDTSSGFAGLGFSKLKDLADPVTGQIQATISILTESDENIQKQIDAATERVDRLIATLELQFAATDLLVSQLESQQSALTSVFEAFRVSQLQ
jgi:flagellar hook-associated protein 2